MKILFKAKDGGKESTVTGYWLIESKSLFSIVLLRFDGDSREAYHSHAFHSFSWLLRGELKEEFKDGSIAKKIYKPSILPFITTRDNFHKVSSVGISWVLSFRTPWKKIWLEHTEKDGTYKLTNGRIKVE